MWAGISVPKRTLISHMQTEIHQGILAVTTAFEITGGAHTSEFSLSLTVKIKLNKHFASATLVFFYTGKQKTLTFGRSLMASCSFMRQHNFCLNTGKILKAMRNAAILTSLCWNLTSQQSSVDLVNRFFRYLLDNHNLPDLTQMERKEPGIGYWLIFPLNVSMILVKPFSCGVLQPAEKQLLRKNNLLDYLATFKPFFKARSLAIISLFLIPLHFIST